MSGLETGHPAAAGPSPAYDFSVFDERNAVFLDSLLDCFGCFSSGLDHLNSSWSIARLREHFRRKNRPQWNGKKAEFREWYVSIHRHLPQYTPRSSGVSVTVQSAILRVWIWTLETQVGASLV